MSIEPAATTTAARFATAARVVTLVTDEGKTLEQALRDSQSYESDAASRAAIQALAYGSLRQLPRIDCWLGLLLDRPDALRQPLVRALLAVGLHQLAFSTHPPHAVVNETVAAVRLLHQARSAGLVNAVLRRFLRERQVIEERVQQDAVGRFAHPAWLIERVRADWPAAWERILVANNEPPPLWLRVNRRRGSVEEYLALLADQGCEASISEHAPEAILLSQPLEVRNLPGFEAGRVSVQDAAAQFAAPLLDAQAGMRVLDACAAPGGKTCHLLERTPDLAELIALDVSRPRLRQVRENLDRLGLPATVLAGNAGRPADWWDGQPFERILLDVPCSATGVIRRHPDIKLLRQARDLPPLAREQLALLRALWPLLAPGGRLLYATCSVLKVENVQVVTSFLAAEPSAAERAVSGLFPGLARHVATGPGLQIFPGEAGMDGFYYACLERRR